MDFVWRVGISVSPFLTDKDSPQAVWPGGNPAPSAAAALKNLPLAGGAAAIAKRARGRAYRRTNLGHHGKNVPGNQCFWIFNALIFFQEPKKELTDFDFSVSSFSLPCFSLPDWLWHGGGCGKWGITPCRSPAARRLHRGWFPGRSAWCSPVLFPPCWGRRSCCGSDCRPHSA